jgi:hypothetical protein
MSFSGIMEGVGTAFPASDDGAGIVDDADRGRLERNVKTDIMALLVHVFLRIAFGTAEATGSPGGRPMLCNYAMSRRLGSGRPPGAAEVISKPGHYLL